MRATALLFALVTAAACSGSSAEEATPSDTPAAILGAQDVAVAERADVAGGILLTGSLQPADVVTIRAQVPGTMANVRVDRGTAVRRGQTLATIEAAGIRSQAAGARAGVAAAEAQVAVARQQLEAARRLQAAGAMSVIELRTAEAQFGAAEAQLAAARASAAAAGESADRATITAPISGVVSEREIEDGEAVVSGDELFTIVDARELELAAQIPVEQAARVRVGQTVVFTLDAAPDREYRGRVARIDPVADAQTRQVGVYVRLANSQGAIVGGQFARGRIVGEAATNAVVVPIGAVRDVGGSPFVLVVADGRIVRRDVTVGARDEGRGIIAVESGLQAGERVVATSTIDLEDGSAVTVASDATNTPAATAPGASPPATAPATAPPASKSVPPSGGR
jgi:RND family efflux transporter MFP subunit